MERLFTAAESRAIDRLAAESLRLPGLQLMQRAGRAALTAIVQRWPAAGEITVLAGKGNNAGDGYIVAGLAAEMGLRARLLQVGPAPSAGDAAAAVQLAADAGVEGELFKPDASARGIVVDALLGTGVSGPLRPPFSEAVRWINQSAGPVCAIDLPTGLDADSGGPCGAADEVVLADLTVTFICRKIGCHTGLGLEVCGDLQLAELGVPGTLLTGGLRWLREPSPPPALGVNAYKHARGHVLVVGGDDHMGGAVALSAEAALRSGAGMVTVVTRERHRAAILARRPEVMVVDADRQALVEDLLARVDAVVLGPGLGREAWGERLCEHTLRAAQAPILVDADGLRWLKAATSHRVAVVTPHTAEAAHLLDCTPVDIQSDRLAAARRLVETFADAAVVKGAGSVIAGHEGAAICGRGNPSMATAGMGDVLAGVIGAELARGCGAQQATEQGVLLHAVAGDRAVDRVGRRGLVASDLFTELALS